MRWLPAPGDPAWRRVKLYVALLLAGFGIWRLVRTFSLHPRLGLGWDFAVLCDAVHVLRRHGDPYLVANLPHHTFSYPYLPYVAYAVSPVCAIWRDGSTVFGPIFLALLAGSALAIGRGLGCSWAGSLLLAIASLAAFDTAPWVVLTGNAAILETPFVALAILAWSRSRFAACGAALGGLAAIKLLPVVALLAFPLLLPWRPALRGVLAGLAVFVPLVGFGWWLAMPFGHDFLGVLTATIPGQHSPAGEFLLGAADPNLPDLLVRLTAAAGLSHHGPAVTLLALLLLGAGFALAHLRRLTGSSTAVFCLTLLVLLVSLFRLHPYAFASLSLLALGACIDAGRVQTGRLLVVLSGLPCALLLPIVPRFGPVFADYTQLVGLLIALAGLALLIDRYPAGEAASRRSIGSHA